MSEPEEYQPGHPRAENQGRTGPDRENRPAWSAPRQEDEFSAIEEGPPPIEPEMPTGGHRERPARTPTALVVVALVTLLALTVAALFLARALALFG